MPNTKAGSRMFLHFRARLTDRSTNSVLPWLLLATINNKVGAVILECEGEKKNTYVAGGYCGIHGIVRHTARTV